MEKFARYFEVEARILDVSEKSKYRLDPELVKKNIDENTIGVFAIMGSTYTGHYEPVEEISKILDEYEEKTGNDIPIRKPLPRSRPSCRDRYSSHETFAGSKPILSLHFCPQPFCCSFDHS